MVFDLQMVLMKLEESSFSNVSCHGQRRWMLIELAGCTEAIKPVVRNRIHWVCIKLRHRSLTV